MRDQIAGRAPLRWERVGTPECDEALKMLRGLRRSVLRCLSRDPARRPTCEALLASWNHMFDKVTSTTATMLTDEVPCSIPATPDIAAAAAVTAAADGCAVGNNSDSANPPTDRSGDLDSDLDQPAVQPGVVHAQVGQPSHAQLHEHACVGGPRGDDVAEGVEAGGTGASGAAGVEGGSGGDSDSSSPISTAQQQAVRSSSSGEKASVGGCGGAGDNSKSQGSKENNSSSGTGSAHVHGNVHSVNANVNVHTNSALVSLRVGVGRAGSISSPRPHEPIQRTSSPPLSQSQPQQVQVQQVLAKQQREQDGIDASRSGSMSSHQQPAPPAAAEELLFTSACDATMGSAPDHEHQEPPPSSAPSTDPTEILLAEDSAPHALHSFTLQRALGWGGRHVLRALNYSGKSRGSIAENSQPNTSSSMSGERVCAASNANTDDERSSLRSHSNRREDSQNIRAGTSPGEKEQRESKPVSGAQGRVYGRSVSDTGARIHVVSVALSGGDSCTSAVRVPGSGGGGGVVAKGSSEFSTSGPSSTTAFDPQILMPLSQRHLEAGGGVVGGSEMPCLPGMFSREPGIAGDGAGRGPQNDMEASGQGSASVGQEALRRRPDASDGQRGRQPVGGAGGDQRHTFARGR